MRTLDEAYLSHSFFADPYSVYREIREKDPVHWVDEWGVWVVTRIDDVSSTLRDYRRLSSFGRYHTFTTMISPDHQEELGPFIKYWTTSGFNESDPPAHTRVRNLVMKAFSPNAINRLKIDIQRHVDELLDRVVDSGSIDLVVDFADELPAIVIAGMLGFPPENHEKYKRWTADYVAFIGEGGPELESMRRSQQAVLEFHEFLAEQIEDRRRHTRDDLLSGLVSAEEQGDQLSNFELLAVCLDLLTGGAATTTNLLCVGMLTLLQHPDQLEALRLDPSLIPSAVEEILRYEPPFQLDIRLVAESFELRGKAIEKGQIMRMAIGAANRDPSVFSDPDRFDIRRSPNKHVTFGLGPHFCAGFHLARTELCIAFETLIRRLSDVRLAEDAKIDWIESYAVRGVTALPLEFEPAAQPVGAS